MAPNHSVMNRVKMFETTSDPPSSAISPIHEQQHDLLNESCSISTVASPEIEKKNTNFNKSVSSPRVLAYFEKKAREGDVDEDENSSEVLGISKSTIDAQRNVQSRTPNFQKASPQLISLTTKNTHRENNLREDSSGTLVHKKPSEHLIKFKNTSRNERPQTPDENKAPEIDPATDRMHPEERCSSSAMSTPSVRRSQVRRKNTKKRSQSLATKGAPSSPKISELSNLRGGRPLSSKTSLQRNLESASVVMQEERATSIGTASSSSRSSLSVDELGSIAMRALNASKRECVDSVTPSRRDAIRQQRQKHTTPSKEQRGSSRKMRLQEARAKNYAPQLERVIFPRSMRATSTNTEAAESPTLDKEKPHGKESRRDAIRRNIISNATLKKCNKLDISINSQNSRDHSSQDRPALPYSTGQSRYQMFQAALKSNVITTSRTPLVQTLDTGSQQQQQHTHQLQASPMPHIRNEPHQTNLSSQVSQVNTASQRRHQRSPMRSSSPIPPANDMTQERHQRFPIRSSSPIPLADNMTQERHQPYQRNISSPIPPVDNMTQKRHQPYQRNSSSPIPPADNMTQKRHQPYQRNASSLIPLADNMTQKRHQCSPMRSSSPVPLADNMTQERHQPYQRHISSPIPRVNIDTQKQHHHFPRRPSYPVPPTGTMPQKRHQPYQRTPPQQMVPSPVVAHYPDAIYHHTNQHLDEVQQCLQHDPTLMYQHHPSSVSQVNIGTHNRHQPHQTSDSSPILADGTLIQKRHQPYQRNLLYPNPKVDTGIQKRHQHSQSSSSSTIFSTQKRHQSSSPSPIHSDEMMPQKRSKPTQRNLSSPISKVTLGTQRQHQRSPSGASFPIPSANNMIHTRHHSYQRNASSPVPQVNIGTQKHHQHHSPRRSPYPTPRANNVTQKRQQIYTRNLSYPISQSSTEIEKRHHPYERDAQSAIPPSQTEQKNRKEPNQQRQASLVNPAAEKKVTPNRNQTRNAGDTCMSKILAVSPSYKPHSLMSQATDTALSSIIANQDVVQSQILPAPPLPPITKITNIPSCSMRSTPDTAVSSRLLGNLRSQKGDSADTTKVEGSDVGNLFVSEETISDAKSPTTFCNEFTTSIDPTEQQSTILRQKVSLSKEETTGIEQEKLGSSLEAEKITCTRLGDVEGMVSVVNSSTTFSNDITKIVDSTEKQSTLLGHDPSISKEESTLIEPEQPNTNLGAQKPYSIGYIGINDEGLEVEQECPISEKERISLEQKQILLQSQEKPEFKDHLPEAEKNDKTLGINKIGSLDSSHDTENSKKDILNKLNKSPSHSVEKKSSPQSSEIDGKKRMPKNPHQLPMSVSGDDLLCSLGEYSERAYLIKPELDEPKEPQLVCLGDVVENAEQNTSSRILESQEIVSDVEVTTVSASTSSSTSPSSRSMASSLTRETSESSTWTPIDWSRPESRSNINKGVLSWSKHQLLGSHSTESIDDAVAERASWSEASSADMIQEERSETVEEVEDFDVNNMSGDLMNSNMSLDSVTRVHLSALAALQSPDLAYTDSSSNIEEDIHESCSRENASAEKEKLVGIKKSEVDPPQKHESSSTSSILPEPHAILPPLSPKNQSSWSLWGISCGAMNLNFDLCQPEGNVAEEPTRSPIFELGSQKRGTMDVENDLYSLAESSNSSSLLESERHRWDEWERRDYLSIDNKNLPIVQELETSKFPAESPITASRRPKENYESRAISDVQIKVPRLPSIAPSDSASEGICGEDSTECEGDIYNSYTEESRSVVALTKSSISEGTDDAAKPALLSFSERRFLEQFTMRLTNQGLEVLKLSRDNKWQLRYLTTTKEVKWLRATDEGCRESGGRVQCPRGILWLKKFAKKNHSISIIARQGRGGLHSSKLIKVTAAGRRDPHYQLSRKLKEKFKESVAVEITYSLDGRNRSVIFLCRNTDDAHLLCASLRVVIAVLERRKK